MMPDQEQRQGADLPHVPAVEVMTAPAIACDERAQLDYVADLLTDREVSGMPVVDRRGEVTGVISERDIAKALGGPLLRLAMHGASKTGPFLREPRTGSWRTAGDVMTTPAVVAEPSTPLHTIADLMMSHGINRVPIVSGGHLVGIVTRGDVLGVIRGAGALDEPTVVVGGPSQGSP